jgi:hypothetical protein
METTDVQKAAELAAKDAELASHKKLRQTEAAELESLKKEVETVKAQLKELGN